MAAAFVRLLYPRAKFGAGSQMIETPCALVTCMAFLLICLQAGCPLRSSPEHLNVVAHARRARIVDVVHYDAAQLKLVRVVGENRLEQTDTIRQTALRWENRLWEVRRKSDLPGIASGDAAVLVQRSHREDERDTR